jgi:hypothetical protein
VVVTEFCIFKSGLLPPKTSVQLAELVTLIEALKLSQEQSQLTLFLWQF